MIVAMLTALTLSLLGLSLALQLAEPHVTGVLGLNGAQVPDLAGRLMALTIAVGALVGFLLVRRLTGSGGDSALIILAEEAPDAVPPAQARTEAASHEAACRALGQTQLFAAARSETLAVLAGQAEPRQFHAGEVLVRQGEAGDEALVLAEGAVEIVVETRPGRVSSLVTLGPGACVGEMAVLSGRPRSATVRARTDVLAYAVPGRALRAATREDVALGAQLGTRIEGQSEAGVAEPAWDARQALAHADLLEAAAPATLEALAAAAQPRHFRAGEVVFLQEEAGDEALVLAHGRVDILAAGRPGREAALATLGPGACVGEMAVLSGRPRSATVRARTDVLAYSVDGAALRAATRADAALADRLSARIDRLGVDAFLKLSSPFKRLPAAAIAQLVERMHRRPVAAGETLVRQGEPGDAFYLVVSGRMDVLRSPGGVTEEAHVVTLGPGDCFGEAALLSDQPRRATVRALDAGEVLELTRADFRPFVEQYQPVQAFFRELSLARFNVAPGQLLAVPDPVTTLLPRLRPSQSERVLAGFGLGLVALAMLSATSISSEWRPIVYLTLLVGGLLPATAYVAYIRERDLLGDLPILMLLGVSAVAATIGVPAAIYLEQFATGLPLPPALLTAVIEEPLKLVPVLWAMRQREYRFELDGVIFGVTAAMGFGGLESLGYGLLAYTQPLQLCLSSDGAACMVQTLWLRIAAAFLGHGPWTAMICATLWRERGRRANLLARPVILAFLLAVLLHTLWDTDPVLFGIPVAVVGILVLRYLMQEGLTHQATALVSLTQGSAGDTVGKGEDSVRCAKCGKTFPPSHIYCVRCGLSLA